MVSRKECEETPNLAIATNVGGTQSVCTLCLKYGARLLFSGSSEEYGTAFKNGAVDESTPFGEPTSIYSMTKRMAEELIQYYSYFKGLTATTMRLFMLYGVGEEPSDYRSAVVRFVDWALRGQPLTVHKGTERSWCYIDDVIEAIELIVKREQENHYEVFNLGKDDPISAEGLAYKILEVCNSPSNIIITDPEPTVIPIKRASFAKAKRLLGWEAKTPLRYGLKQVAESLRD
jgi:nucleoside-diphosphate-sugar epimerase